MSEKLTIKDRLDSWIGDKDIKQKLNDTLNKDVTVPEVPTPQKNFDLEAKKIFEKIANGTQLDPSELMLLPTDLVKDLNNNLNNNATPADGNYILPKVLSNDFDRQRATRRIIRNLADNQETYDKKETLSALSQTFMLLKEQEKNRSDEGFSDIDASKRRQLRRDDLRENAKSLIIEFAERDYDIENEVKAFLDEGSMDYEDAYLYFAAKSKNVEKLDIGDFFLRDHPSRSFAEEIPFYGSVLGISKLAQLSDKIEALDAASPGDLQEPAYVDMIRDVGLYLDSQRADKTVPYKIAESFSMMADYILTRGIGRTSQMGSAKQLFKMFPRMKKAFTLAQSKGFRNKILSATKKGTTALADEAILAVNPLGRGLSTWEQVEEHRIRGQELIGIEVDEIKQGPTKGQKGVKYLNFGNPKEHADAWLSAVGTSIIEGLTERMGGVVDFSKASSNTFMGQVFNGALFKSLKKKNPDVPADKLFEFMENSNINGIIPEILEERASDITIGALGVDQPGMEIKPGFQLFNNETKDWETEFAEIVIPTLEDFGIEVFTIATVGGLSRKMSAARGGQLPPMAMRDDGPVVKGSDPMVRDFVDAGKTQAGEPRKVKVTDAIVARTNEILEKYGVKPLRYNRKGKVSPQFLKKAKERGRLTLVGDLVEWFTNPSNKELTEYAATWYGDRFEQTMNLLSKDFPELNSDDGRAFFTFLVGVTSPSQAPEPNLRNAINEFMIDKGFPSDTKTSEAVSKQIAKFKKIAAHKGGYKAAMDFLSQKMTGEELRKEFFEMGVGDFKFDEKKGIIGELGFAKLSEEVYGAEMFGPKVGAFTLNLSGVSDIATIDLWMLREISMHLGIPFDNKTIGQVNYSLKRAKDKGPTKTDWADNLNLERVDKKDNGQRKRILIYREIMNDVQKEFNKQTGENYSVADVQALVWYMSKSMFASYGTVSSDVSMSDYLTVAESLVNSNGVFNERTQRRIRTDEELGADERSEEVASDNTESNSEESVQEESGTDVKPTDSKESDGRRLSGDDDPEDTPEVPKKRPSPLTKEVPQVPEIESGQAGTFVNNLTENKSQDETGYTIDAKDEGKYSKPFFENKGKTKVTPTLIMSEDGKAGAAILHKTHEDGKTEVEITSVYTGQEGITHSEVMRSAIRKAQRLGTDRIIVEAFEGDMIALYELYGFVEAESRDWDDSKAPSDWQENHYKKLFPDTKGKPKVITMVHDPAKASAEKGHPFKIRQGLEGEFEYKEPGLFGMITRHISDVLDPLKGFKKQFEKNIRKLRPKEDFFNRARLSYNIAIGKFEGIVEWYEDFIPRMAKDGFSRDMLDEYLHAKHAKERNFLVNTRNPDVEAGAGYNQKGELMTDKKADEILKKYKDTTIDDYAQEFRRNIILRNIQVRQQGGLLTDDQARIYSGDAPISKSENPGDNIAFKNYVPLNLEFEDDGQVGGMFRDMKGVSGFALDGPEARRIKGTESENKRASIVEMGMKNLLMGMTRAEANQTNLRLLETLRATDVFINIGGEKKALFEIKEVDRKDSRNYNQNGDPKYVFAGELAENQIMMKENGIEYIVTINSPQLAKSFKKGAKYGKSFLTQTLLGVNNFRKQFITTFSPTFFIGNVQSDLQTGLSNLGIENGATIAAKAAANIVQSAGAIADYNFNKPNERPNTKAMRWYKEMIAYGGKISFFDFEGEMDRYKKLSDKISRLGPKGQADGIIEGGLNFMRKGNEVLEGQMRLATYIAMREEGIDAETAAVAARDVTLDFNKAGELGPLMEAAYMFSKVGVNQLYRVGKTFKDHPAKATALSSSFMLAGYFAAEAAYAHDDEEWDKKGDWAKDHYWHFKNIFFNRQEGEKTGPGHIPVRMAYGWGMFAGLGVLISDWRREQAQLLPGEEAAEGYWVARAFDIILSNFAPASGAPTIIGQVGTDLINNKDAIGRTIKPYKYDPDVSDWQNSYPETPKFIKDLSWILSNAPYPGNPGLTPDGSVDKYGQLSYNDSPLDMNPEELDYFLNQGLSGVFTTFKNTLNSMDDRSDASMYNKIYRKTYDGLDPKGTPFLRKFYSYQPTKSHNESTATRLFFQSKDRQLNTFEVEAYDNAIRNLYKEGIIGLDEYNKRFTDAFDNQTRQLGIPKRLRKQILKENTKEIGKVKGRNIKNRPKVKRTKVGFKNALDKAKDRMEERTKD